MRKDKKGIDKNQHQIVVEYYCAKWGIKHQNIVKIQVSKAKEKVVVKIETPRISEFEDRTKLNEKNASSLAEKGEPSEVLKKRAIWWYLLHLLRIFYLRKSIQSEFPNNSDF